MWKEEINSEKLSKNVQKIVDNIDVSEEDVVEEIEKHVNSGSYDKAVELIASCKLSDEQKNTYFDLLVEKTNFESFEANGLVCNIPECWYTETESDHDSVSVQYYPEKDSLFSWYVGCKGTVEQVVRDENDSWARDENYSPTTIDGCSEAYIRHESKETINKESYSTIEYYVICQGFVYNIQYFAYNERFFEPEAILLLDSVDFEGYANAEIQGNRQEQTYINATNLLVEGEYEEAIVLLEQLGDYKDSKDLIDNAISLQLQQVEDYKSSCTELAYVDDLDYVGSIDVKVYAQVKSRIRNSEYYIITENGETIQIWNNSSREELIEGEWITIYGNAYGHGDNMTIRVEYIDK